MRDKRDIFHVEKISNKRAFTFLCENNIGAVLLKSYFVEQVFN